KPLVRSFPSTAKAPASACSPPSPSAAPPYHAAAIASLSPGGCRSRAISPPFFRHAVKSRRNTNCKI
uniref:Uncharacterized protein n=1 Tax=Oryza rufipogon TaxID=4529 RepID=A0A0E0NUF5_ORYRU